MSSSILSRIKEVVSRPLRIFKSYVRRQLFFAISMFIGVLFIMLAITDFILEILPGISRWIVLLVLGVIVMLLGYFQKIVK